MRFWFSLERLSVREENNSRYKFQVPSCKQVAKTKDEIGGWKSDRRWFAVEWFSACRGEFVIRSRAWTCSSRTHALPSVERVLSSVKRVLAVFSGSLPAKLDWPAIAGWLLYFSFSVWETNFLDNGLSLEALKII